MTENVNVPENNNTVQISDEVIAIVSGVAAMGIDGVFAMANSFTNGIAELLGKKNLAKGVKVDITEKDVKIAVSFVVKHGFKIPDVAWQVQENVKKAVETMTGLNVLTVDVCVSGVEFEKTETIEQKPSIEKEDEKQ